MSVRVERNEGEYVEISEGKARSLIEQTASLLEAWADMDADEIADELQGLSVAYEDVMKDA